MADDPVTKTHLPSWVGPVAAAIILVGGYVGYDQWKGHNAHNQECARLKRAFEGNMDSMMGRAEGAISEAKRVGNQSPMGALTGDVAANQVVLNQLNADCPGWTTIDY